MPEPPDAPWPPIPEIDELFVHRRTGARWRVVQVAENDSTGTPWLATLEAETEYWRPLKGSGIAWQLQENTRVRFITVHQNPSYDRFKESTR